MNVRYIKDYRNVKNIYKLTILMKLFLIIKFRHSGYFSVNCRVIIIIPLPIILHQILTIFQIHLNDLLHLY